VRRGIVLLVSAVLLPLLLVTGCGEDRKIAKPATANELVQTGLIQLNKGDQAKALESFEQAAAKEPTNHVAHYNVGVILQEQGKTAEALAAYGRALSAKPDFVSALFNSAVLYTSTDPDLAISTYRRIIKLQPIAPTAYLNLGLLEAAKGEVALARQHLAKAVEQDGSLASAIPKDVFSAKRVAPASPSPTASPTATPTG